MAAPPEVTLKDLSGQWVMVSLPARKTLRSAKTLLMRTAAEQNPLRRHRSNPPNGKPAKTPFLAFHLPTITQSTTLNLLIHNVQQGVNWFLRRAISLATITLTITQYTSPDPPHSTHIDIAQMATGGISGTTEKRTLDWEVRGHKDGIFGEVTGKSRWVDLKKLEGGGSQEFLRTGWLDEGRGVVVQSWVESVGGGWTAEQVCYVCFGFLFWLWFVCRRERWVEGREADGPVCVGRSGVSRRLRGRDIMLDMLW